MRDTPVLGRVSRARLPCGRGGLSFMFVRHDGNGLPVAADPTITMLVETGQPGDASDGGPARAIVLSESLSGM